MSYPIVGICGRAGVGKNTIADMITEEFGAAQIAFAAPLKKMATIFFSEENIYGSSELRNEKVGVPVFSLPHPHNWNPLSKALCELFEECDVETKTQAAYRGTQQILKLYKEQNNTISVRQFLQYIGTDLGRKFNPNIWAQKGLNGAKAAISDGAPFVLITDVRFRNEALAIKEADGILIKIEAAGIATSNDSHASEQELGLIPDFWFDHRFPNHKKGLDLLRHYVRNRLNPYELFKAKTM